MPETLQQRGRQLYSIDTILHYYRTQENSRGDKTAVTIRLHILFDKESDMHV